MFFRYRELPFFSPISKMEAEGQELVSMISSLYSSALPTCDRTELKEADEARLG